MGILTPVYSDNFVRANGPLTAPWVTVTNFYSGTGVHQLPVLLNRGWTVTAPGVIAEGNSFGVYNATLPRDQYSHAALTAVGDNGTDTQLGCVVRATLDGQNGYYIINGPNTFGGNQYCAELWKVVGGIFTQIGETTTRQNQVGDTFEIWAVGNRISGFINGIQIWSVIDSDLSSGFSGIMAETADGPNSTNTTIASNWVSGSVVMPVQMTLATDNFTRPNENPLSQGGNWSAMTGWGPLEVVSNQCQNSDGGSDGATYSGITWPDDQWAEITVGSSFAANSSAIVLLRSDPATLHGYWLQIIGPAVGNTVIVNLYMYDGSVHLLETTTTPGGPGDVFQLQAQGTQLTAFQNGIPLFSPLTDTTYASGNASIEISGAAGLTTLAAFAGGGLSAPAPVPPGAYSVPDDRNFSVFPNNAIDVQGTETYVIPAHPSHPAPADSRAAGAPADSRISPNIPENSRVLPS